jgi:hypothetical protein
MSMNRNVDPSEDTGGSSAKVDPSEDTGSASSEVDSDSEEAADESGLRAEVGGSEGNG